MSACPRYSPESRTRCEPPDTRAAHRLGHQASTRGRSSTLVPGDITMAMMLPSRSEYVNFHPTTMHLFEIDDKGRTLK